MEEYYEREKKSGIKTGDRVRVFTTADNYEMGWALRWSKAMTDMVGREFTVMDMGSPSEFSRDWCDGVKLINEHGTAYWFPYFVLEKPSKHLAPSELNPDLSTFEGRAEKTLHALTLTHLKNQQAKP